MYQWGTVNLEASMEWSPAWICSRSGTLPYLHQRHRPWLEIVNWIPVLKFTDDTKIFSKICNKTSSNTLCRVLSLSDCRYSLNPLSQTRIDLSRTLSNMVDVQTELCLAFMVSIRRIVTYNIFINKQLQHINGYK